MRARLSPKTGLLAVGVREQLGHDVALGGGEGEEPAFSQAVSTAPGVSPSTLSAAAQTASTSS
jgi:hypothetical protein